MGADRSCNDAGTPATGKTMNDCRDVINGGSPPLARGAERAYYRVNKGQSRGSSRTAGHSAAVSSERRAEALLRAKSVTIIVKKSSTVAKCTATLSRDGSRATVADYHRSTPPNPR